MSRHWYPVVRSNSLRGKPLRVILHDVPLVLFRTANGLACLKDVCPHRFAPLSAGRVVDGDIECPYHGWRFDSSGRCTKIPLLEGCIPDRFAAAYAAVEKYGLIFVTKDPDGAEPVYGPTWDEQPFVRHVIEVDCESTLADAVENVLDPIHTLFVHRGLLRGSRKRSSLLEITTRVRRGILEVDFLGEEGQDGLLSRLLEGARTHSSSSFRQPGIVELKYHGPQGLNLVTTLYFTRTQGDRHRGFAVMTGPNAYGFGRLKALFFVPIMKTVIAQDRKIMQQCHANWMAAGKPRAALSPLDILRPGIDAVLEGRDELPETRLALAI